MRPRKNPEAISKVLAADLSGLSMERRKPLYIEQNTFDVGLDVPIYRIFQAKFLIQDIQNGCLTHSRIGEVSWGDPVENPLLNRTFTLPETGETLSLNALVQDYFGVCWSLKTVAASDEWSYFSYGANQVVRIQSTPRKLLQGVMDLSNPFFMLHHFIGKMEYVTDDEFDKYFEDNDYAKHLDSLGQGIALSVFKLPDGPASEMEVRLAYHFDEGADWDKNHVRIRGNFAEVPFCWEGVIDEIIVPPGCDQTIPTSIKELLQPTQSLG